MTSLTKSLFGRLKLKEKVAAQELVAIAKRESAGKVVDGDVSKLESALHLSRKNPEHYEESVALLQRVKTLKVAVAKLQAASSAYAEARGKILPYQFETERLAQARREGQLQLEQTSNAEYSEYQKAARARAELERLQFSYPELFDGKAVDLDALTLTSGDGANLINFRDEAAVHWEVPMPVWQEQSSRRARIRQAAAAKAHAEYQDKRNGWIEKQPKDYYGHYVAAEPFPKFELPAWREIVAKGWHKTLDGMAA